MNQEEMKDVLIAQADQIDMLIGQNTAYRTVISALLATHADKPKLLMVIDRMREVSAAKSLYGGASDVSLSEADRVVAELVQPLREA